VKRQKFVLGAQPNIDLRNWCGSSEDNYKSFSINPPDKNIHFKNPALLDFIGLTFFTFKDWENQQNYFRDEKLFWKLTVAKLVKK
jgi:hypothetical protein